MIDREFKISPVNTVIHGDCMEEMVNIEDGLADMVLCDLPYEQTARNAWDIALPFDKLWQLYDKVTKPNAAIVLFANGMFTADLMVSNKKNWRYNLVWNKVLPSGFLNAKKMPLRGHEDICVFYRKPPLYKPKMSVGEKSHSVGKAKGKSQEDVSRNTNYGKLLKVDTDSSFKYPKSILTFQKPHPSTSLVPTQKPVLLCEYLIETFTNENAVVLDNCAGSFTTAIACDNTNRKWICIEKDEKSCEIGRKRIEENRKELSRPKQATFLT